MRTIIDKLKGAWRSVTIWFNGLLLASLPLYDAFKDSLPDMQEYLPGDIYKWVGVAVVVVNLALRFKTKTDLAHK
jgi:hypothetical protein